MGPFRDYARHLLERLQAGTCTTGDVAKLSADVLANPPPLMTAAQRYLRAVGTEHEGAVAVAFLDLLVGVPSSAEVAAASNRPGRR